MDERRCEEQFKACQECDVSKQLSASYKLTLETLDNNLDTEIKPDGTVSFSTLYAFKKDPKEVFPPEKSNFEAAKKQAERTFRKILKKKDGLKEIKSMFARGQAEGNFEIVNDTEASQILKAPHFFATNKWLTTLNQRQPQSDTFATLPTLIQNTCHHSTLLK